VFELDSNLRHTVAMHEHESPFLVRRAGDWFGLSLVVLAVGCTSPRRSASENPDSLQHRYEFTQPQMGVPFRMVLYAPDAAIADSAAKAAFGRVKQLNDLLTDYDTDSELNQLSRTSGEGRAVPVSPDLWNVLARSQALARQSDGAFDVTVGPVVSLWRKARWEKRLPNAARLAEARAAVGYEKVLLKPRRRTVCLLAPNMHLDLGGIAKGYAVDAALAALREHGIRRALVAGSGDMAAGDPPPGKNGWRIEIAPLDVTNAPAGRFVLLRRCAIATSGDVFQRLEINGTRYSHIVDPRTGIGLTDHSLVTVIAPDCTTADSLATAVSVLGPKQGLRLVRRTPGASARIVRQPGQNPEVVETRGFRKLCDPADPDPGEDPR
jgi:FAD:protein FMN transferase